jgi:hypothetical protein
MESMMKKRIEMIFETTRVQHTLYVLRSGPAAGGALGLLLMLLVAASGHQMKPATFDFITESLLFLSLFLLAGQRAHWLGVILMLAGEGDGQGGGR